MSKKNILHYLLPAILFFLTSCKTEKNITVTVYKVSDHCGVKRDLNEYLKSRRELRVINETETDRIIFSVGIDQPRMERYDISLNDIVERLKGCCTFIKNAETDSAGSIYLLADKCSLSGNELEEIKKCVLKNIDGVPVYVYDIAMIQAYPSLQEDIRIGIEVRQTNKNYKKLKKEINSYVDEMLSRKIDGVKFSVE